MRIVSRKVCQSTSLPSVHQYISTCDSIFNSRNSKAVIPVYKGRVKGFPSAARSSGYVIGGRILPEAWGWRLFLQTLHPTASGKEAFENENDRPVTHRTKRKIIRKVRARERENTVLHREVATRGNHRSSANRDTDLRADHSRQVLEMQQRHMTEIQTKEAEHKKEVSRLIRLVEKLCAWFPLVNDSRSSSRG